MTAGAPRPRRQPPDVRREQLLDAAERVLLSRGLRATTVADVAAAAGLAKGTVYLYFRSKDELLAGLRARYLERYAEALRSSRSGPAPERIRRMVVGLYEFAVEHHELHHLLFHDAGFSEADAFAAMRDRLGALLAEAVDAGDAVLPDVAVATSFLLHGVHGAVVDAVHAGARRSRRRTAEAIADLVDRVLYGSG